MVEAKYLTHPQKWKPRNQINKLIQKYNQQNKTQTKQILQYIRGVGLLKLQCISLASNIIAMKKLIYNFKSFQVIHCYKPNKNKNPKSKNRIPD